MGRYQEISYIVELASSDECQLKLALCDQRGGHYCSNARLLFRRGVAYQKREKDEPTAKGCERTFDVCAISKSDATLVVDHTHAHTHTLNGSAKRIRRSRVNGSSALISAASQANKRTFLKQPLEESARIKPFISSVARPLNSKSCE